TEWVNAVAVTADGRRALSGSGDETLRWWDLATGRCLRVLEGHTYGVDAVAVTADGRRALSGCGLGTLRWWDLATGRCLALFPHWSVGSPLSPGRRGGGGRLGGAKEGEPFSSPASRTPP